MTKGLEKIAKDLDKLIDDTMDFVEPETHHNHGFIGVIGELLEDFFCDYLDLC